MGNQLLDDILENVYVAGFICTDEQRLAQIVESEGEPASVTASDLATKYIGIPGLFARPAIPKTGAQPSSTAGALESWLAVHEAGHAIVAVRGGLPVRGVRFFEPTASPEKPASSTADGIGQGTQCSYSDWSGLRSLATSRK
jgi:hypothetical protein